MSEIEQFEHHAARAFFASAWADMCDEQGPGVGSGVEIMDILPSITDPAAIHAARTLRMAMERVNGVSVTDLMRHIEKYANGDRAPTMEYFGHHAAMQAMGHGVGLLDAFGYEAHDWVRIPYVEFGSYSLEHDYF